MPSSERDLRIIARGVISAPATRWRMLPLTVQLMLLGVGLVVAWMLATRAYDHVTGPQHDVEARAQHWQHAELIAERMAAAAYQLQGAVRGYALTGDTVRRRDADEAGQDTRRFSERWKDSSPSITTSCRTFAPTARWHRAGVRPSTPPWRLVRHGAMRVPTSLASGPCSTARA